jgi:hypothetical protein
MRIQASCCRVEGIVLAAGACFAAERGDLAHPVGAFGCVVRHMLACNTDNEYRDMGGDG